MSLVEPALRRRAELVLRIAESHAVDHLVLGAWGCGVFQNNPALVASVFADLLQAPGPFARAFSTVVFAVYDQTESQAVFKAFDQAFNQNP